MLFWGPGTQMGKSDHITQKQDDTSAWKCSRNQRCVPETESKIRRQRKLEEGRVKSTPGHHRKLMQSGLTPGTALVPALEATWLLMRPGPLAAQKSGWAAKFHPRTEPAVTAGEWINFRQIEWPQVEGHLEISLTVRKRENILGNTATTALLFSSSFFWQSSL